MVYILGAGGMAKETLSIYKDLGKSHDVYGFIEENCKRKSVYLNDVKILDSSIINSLPKKSTFIGAIGSPKRKKWINEIERLGFDFDSIIHPTVICGNSVNINKGCILSPGSIFTEDITIGKHSIININTNISHDCVLGNFVTISPGVNIGGNVNIQDNSWVGIGATILNKVSIGKNSLIAGGAVVIDDIPDNVLAIGVPAKPVKKLTKSEWDNLI